MAKFEYTALNKDNKTAKGIMEASSQSAATETLRSQGFKPLSVKAKKTGFDPNNIQFGFLKRTKPKTKDLVVFTRQLSTMINAGVPLVRSLNTLVQQTDSEGFRRQSPRLPKMLKAANRSLNHLKPTLTPSRRYM